MRTAFLTFLAIFLWLAPYAVAADDHTSAGTGATPSAVPAGDDDVVLKAMRDELNRSMKQLKLPNKPAPYFIGYRITDETTDRFGFNNGSVIFNWRDCRRNAWADVRVGDYKFDNTADVNGDSSSSQAVWRGTSLDNDYSVIRRSLWDATDQAYKTASEEYDNMLSYKSQHTIPNLCESFSKEEPIIQLRPIEKPIAIPDEMKTELKELSKVLAATPGTRESWVACQIIESTRWFVNSEGSAVRDSWHSIKIGMAVFVRCPDGEEIWDSETVVVNDLKELPSMKDFEQRAKKLSERLVVHAKSPIKDYYLGPLLLEPQATAELTIRDIAPLLCAEKGDNLRPQGTFLRSLNSKVMPSFLSITDDPSLDQFKEKPLGISFFVDSEGIKCRQVKLIDRGFLKDFLVGRTPVLPGQKSNGHDFIGTAPTTLIVEADNPMPRKSLYEKLRTLAQDNGLKEYLVIRRIRPSTPLFMNGSSSSARESSLEGEDPVEAVMISTASGEERRVRGLKLKELYKPSLQDIICAGSDTEAVTTTLWNGYLRNVICPSILLSKIELEADSRPTDTPYPVPPPTAND